LEAFIKTNFTETHNNKLDKIIGCGSITDGIFKLQVHIINFSEETYYTLNINKGDKIEIKGVLQTTSKNIY